MFDENPNLMVVGNITDGKATHSALLAMVELRRRRGRNNGVALALVRSATAIMGCSTSAASGLNEPLIRGSC